MSKFDLLDGLNDEQRKAVTSTEGYIRLWAGAGSGKTKTLSHRFAYLVNECGISPSRIFCVTFTNKAANEMKKRIRNLIYDNDCGYISTFHGFCVTVLREDISFINYPKNFRILDKEDQKSILSDIYKEQNYSSKNITYHQILSYISKYKEKLSNDLIELGEENLRKKYMETSIERPYEKITYGYLYYQKKLLALDFDDLIIFTIYILSTNEDIKIKWQKRLQYIMVDEFQDVSSRQYALVNILSGYYKNLFVVGDPNQTIYSFRGANIEFFTQFPDTHPNCTTIYLNKNYRSTQNILNASNSLISHNGGQDIKLDPQIRDEIPVYYYHAKHTIDEADWISNVIKDLIQKGVEYKDISILYRSHSVSKNIEESLVRNKIPYKIYSGIPFYERREIKDVLAYLHMIVYQDDLSFKRIINVPARGIGKKKIEILSECANSQNCSLYEALKNYVNINSSDFLKTKATQFVSVIDELSNNYKDLSLQECVSRLLNDIGYEEFLRLDGDQERLDNVMELKNSIYDFESSFGEDVSLDEYLERIALYTNTDNSNKSNMIKLMTIHSAKGLEFPCVFVCGLNEGIFPSSLVKTKPEMQEERRLAYVAFTRAEKNLFLTDAEGLTHDGLVRYPSRFLFNIKKEFLNYLVDLDESFESDAKNQINISEVKLNNTSHPNNRFNKGDEVKHKIFGTGIIKGINSETSNYIIEFHDLPDPKEREISFNYNLSKVIPNYYETNGKKWSESILEELKFPVKQLEQFDNNPDSILNQQGNNIIDYKDVDFAIGDRVKHHIFGEGTIISVKSLGDDSLIEVKFDGLPEKKKIMANFAKIMKIVKTTS